MARHIEKFLTVQEVDALTDQVHELLLHDYHGSDGKLVNAQFIQAAIFALTKTRAETLFQPVAGTNGKIIELYQERQ